MTAAALSALAGLVLSLGFSYLPGLREWFKVQTAEWKRLIVASFLLGTAGIVFGLGCADIGTWVTCDQGGLIELGTVLFYALVANQTTFLISPQLANGEGVRQMVGRMKNGAGGKSNPT